MENDTSLQSTKLFCCPNIFIGNIKLNIYLNLIATAQNGLMTLIPPAEQTPVYSFWLKIDRQHLLEYSFNIDKFDKALNTKLVLKTPQLVLQTPEFNFHLK